MSTLGTFGLTLFTSAIVLSLFQVRRYPAVVRCTVFAISMALGFVEVGGLRLLAYPAGVLGELSVTTQILLASTVAKHVPGIEILSGRDRSVVLWAAGLAGLFLYPLSSGLTMLDTYSLGYDSKALILGLAFLTLGGWFLRARVSFIIPLGLIALNLRLLGSTNLWDYLLDPLIVLFAWGWGVAIVASRLL